MFEKGEGAVHDAEEIKQMIYESAKKNIEDSGLIKLATHRPKETDLHLHLWKQQRSWYSDGNSTCNIIYQCPLKTKFGCPCQFKVTDTTHATYVEKRGTHDNISGLCVCTLGPSVQKCSLHTGTKCAQAFFHAVHT